MTTLWQPLRRMLADWSRAGRRLPIWWRDDDTVGPSSQLDRLHRVSRDLGMPVHLAIIPAEAKAALAPMLDGQFRAVVHGWAHLNHAPDGAKSSEFGTPRRDALDDAARGLMRLRSLFGDRVHPMFVPPWNRIDPGLVAELPTVGFNMLSTFGPRPAEEAAPGLAVVNTHLDPVDWHGTRGLVDPEILVSRLTAMLENRRQGAADAKEPLGLLTHHRMMDDATWEFCRDLLMELNAGPIELFDIAKKRGTA